MTQRTKNIDVALVYQLWNRYATTCNSGDFAGWISLWDDEGIQMPPDAPHRVGKEAIREGMQEMFDQFNISGMVIQTEEIRILGDLAYSHGTYEYEMTPKAGGRTKRFSGKFLDIVEKQADGSWKIAIDCHNYSRKPRILDIKESK
jgi:uncharacterized protein (TIGR02246 family)